MPASRFRCKTDPGSAGGEREAPGENVSVSYLPIVAAQVVGCGTASARLERSGVTVPISFVAARPRSAASGRPGQQRHHLAWPCSTSSQSSLKTLAPSRCGGGLSRASEVARTVKHGTVSNRPWSVLTASIVITG